MLLPKFYELQSYTQELAHMNEIKRIDKEFKDNVNYQKRYAIKNDVTEKISKLEKALWEEIGKKIDRVDVEK